VLNPVSLEAPPVAAAPLTVSTALVEALVRLGVTHAFGVMGGAIAPFFHAVAHSAMTALHLRHESGATFAAVEASLASRRPVLVFTTAGPGLTNAVTGLLAARWEGAHVILVSAATSAVNRGRIATQETIAPLDGLLAGAGGGHLAVTIEHPRQVPQVMSQLAIGLARPGGFVAHLSLPIDVQVRRVRASHRRPSAGLAPRCAPATIAAHAARFAAEPPVVWLGFGARHAAAPIRALVERLGARVMCSPRAKGIFPEDHPLYLGVTGVGGHARVGEALAAARPRHILVLGTRLGESTSFWSDELTPRDSFIHVDVDPRCSAAPTPTCRPSRCWPSSAPTAPRSWPRSVPRPTSPRRWCAPRCARRRDRGRADRSARST
jgi:acetolactate synthase-1/2/3 large subunit